MPGAYELRTGDYVDLPNGKKHVPDLLKAVKYFYGITDVPSKAGFITPDGFMLDFSGRMLRGYDEGYLAIEDMLGRQLLHSDYKGTNRFTGYSLEEDHPEIKKELRLSKLRFDSYLMYKTGCITVARDDDLVHGNYARFWHKPTDFQIHTLAYMFLGRELIIEQTQVVTHYWQDVYEHFRNVRKMDIVDWLKDIEPRLKTYDPLKLRGSR